MIYPMTYILIFLWLLLEVSFDTKYFKLLVGGWGIILGFLVILGQGWIAIDSTSNTMSSVTFNFPDDWVLGLFMILINILIMAMTFGIVGSNEKK